MRKEKIIENIKKYDFIEIGIENDKQIYIRTFGGIYNCFLEKWNEEDEDWEILHEFAYQTNLEKLVDSIMFLFNL